MGIIILKSFKILASVTCITYSASIYRLSLLIVFEYLLFVKFTNESFVFLSVYLSKLIKRMYDRYITCKARYDGRITPWIALMTASVGAPADDVRPLL